MCRAGAPVSGEGGITGDRSPLVAPGSVPGSSSPLPAGHWQAASSQASASTTWGGWSSTHGASVRCHLHCEESSKDTRSPLVPSLAWALTHGHCESTGTNIPPG